MEHNRRVEDDDSNNANNAQEDCGCD